MSPKRICRRCGIEFRSDAYLSCPPCRKAVYAKHDREMGRLRKTFNRSTR